MSGQGILCNRIQAKITLRLRQTIFSRRVVNLELWKLYKYGSNALTDISNVVNCLTGNLMWSNPGKTNDSKKVMKSGIPHKTNVITTARTHTVTFFFFFLSVISRCPVGSIVCLHQSDEHIFTKEQIIPNSERQASVATYIDCTLLLSVLSSHTDNSITLIIRLIRLISVCRDEIR
jgi:hypothetical protein